LFVKGGLEQLIFEALKRLKKLTSIANHTIQEIVGVIKFGYCVLLCRASSRKGTLWQWCTSWGGIQLSLKKLRNCLKRRKAAEHFFKQK
jgi:hypothetical protein